MQLLFQDFARQAKIQSSYQPNYIWEFLFLRIANVVIAVLIIIDISACA